MLENIFEKNKKKLRNLVPAIRKVENCKHCGLRIISSGMTSHTKGLRCFAGRVAISAQLEGYTPCTYFYSSLISPFCKRFPTLYEKNKPEMKKMPDGKFVVTDKTKAKAALKNSLWIEQKFVILLEKFINIGLVTNDYEERKLKLDPSIHAIFEQLAENKRKNKSLDQPLAALELVYESTDKKALLGYPATGRWASGVAHTPPYFGPVMPVMTVQASQILPAEDDENDTLI